jgi:hypothetical protein
VSEIQSLRPRGPKSKDYLFVKRVRLDITDLRAIETALHGIGDVEVTSEQFAGKGQSIDDFIPTGAKTLEHVMLEGSNHAYGKPQYSYLRVMLDPTKAFLSGSADDHLVAGVILSIEQILRSRQRRFAKFCADYLASIGLMPGLAALFLAGLVGTGKNAKPELGFELAVPGFIAVTIGLAAFVIGRLCPGEIMLVSRDAVPGWFKRNRDGLIVQVVGGAVVLFIGIGIGLWIK